MTRYQIQSEHGRLKRVTVEHGVINTETVVKLQAQLKQQLPQVNLKSKADLHLTQFFFGQPELLWEDVRRDSSSIDFKPFFGHFIRLIGETEHAFPDAFNLKVTGIAQFGGREEPVIVLLLDQPSRMLEHREQIHSRFLHFLYECGVSDPVGFMDRHFALHHQLPEHFRPHLSLGRARGMFKLPQLDLDEIEIAFTPSRLRNVKVMERGRWVWSH